MPAGLDLHGLGPGGLIMSLPCYPMLSSGAHAAFVNVYYAAGNATALGNNAFATGTLFAGPLVLNLTGTLATMGIRLGVNGGAGSVARVGIYKADPVTLLPAGLVVSSAEYVMDSGAAVFRNTTISVPITAPTLIWLAYICGVSAPTVAQATNGAGATFFGFNTGSTAGASIAIAQAYGALPDPFPTINNTHITTSPPGVLVQYA